MTPTKNKPELEREHESKKTHVKHDYFQFKRILPSANVALAYKTTPNEVTSLAEHSID